jgi:hypothetical protein
VRHRQRAFPRLVCYKSGLRLEVSTGAFPWASKRRLKQAFPPAAKSKELKRETMGKKVPIEVPLTEASVRRRHAAVVLSSFSPATSKSEDAAREMAEYLREIMEERLGSQEVGKH